MHSNHQSALRALRLCDRPAEGGESFSIAISGDLCPRASGEQRVLAGEEKAILAKVSPYLADADLRIVQWETPLSANPRPIPKSGPNLNCIPQTAKIAAAGGFELALLANNHIGDQGPEAVMETIEHLRAVGVRSVGAGRNLCEANAPAVFQIAGRSLAVLNYAENEFGGAGASRAGFAPLAPVRNLAAIRAARQQYDFVVVTLHGGHERNPFPSPRMQELFRAYAEAGAHVVFNCHTHCPEGVEFHEGTPIVYSPGNFYFPWDVNKSAPEGVGMWWTGYLPKFHFDAKGCHAVEVMPYLFTPGEVRPLDAAGFTEFERYFKKICEQLSDPEQMQSLFEAWSSVSAEGYLKRILSKIPADWAERLNEHKCELPSSGQSHQPTHEFPDKVKMLHDFGLLGLRNQFTCESHADMTRCYLRLVEEGRLEQARARFPELLAYQNPPWHR